MCALGEPSKFAVAGLLLSLAAAVFRASRATLQSLLNVCVNDAFIQGENDFSVWWLYKHALSTASYELYTKQSTTYTHMKTEYDEPSMPFYQKVLPEHVRSEQRALVMATIAHGKRALALQAARAGMASPTFQ